jgi:hypothetical protein
MCLPPLMLLAPCAFRSHGPPPLPVPLVTARVCVAMLVVPLVILAGPIVGASGRRGFRLAVLSKSLLLLLALMLS